MRTRFRATTLALLLASWPAPGLGAEYYLDPVNGDLANDGSAAHPWPGLQAFLSAQRVETRDWPSLPYQEGMTLVPKNPGAPVKAGDTLWLLSGHHGELFVQSAYNERPVTLAAAPGASPTLSKAHFQAAAHWTLRGVSISPTHAPTPHADTLVFVENHGYRGPSFDIAVDDCELFSVRDSAAWTETDWNERACNGVRADGDRSLVRGNRLLNVDFGISVSGRDARVLGNRVENFAGDGLRGLGDGGLFEGNVVVGCHKVNQNHDDAFQSWSVGPDGVGTGEVRGITLRGNLFVNYLDPDQPFRGPLQGIGCFDGFFVDWVIENNVILTDHWHGITLTGARNCRIVNNTVLDLNDQSPGPPWILVAHHKNGTPSQGNLLRNNLAASFNLDDGAGLEDHNLAATDYAALFVDAAGLDLHLREGSPAIDQGSPELAPSVDFDGVPRPQGAAVDLGAYEHHTGPVGTDAGLAGDAAIATDAGAADGPADASAADAGTGAQPEPDQAAPEASCGCHAGGSSGTFALWMLSLAAAFTALRRSAAGAHGPAPSSAGAGRDHRSGASS